MQAHSPFVYLFLIARTGTVSLAGPLIPLSPSALLTIAVFHHPPPSRHSRRTSIHSSWEVNPLPYVCSEITPPVPHLVSTWLHTTTNLILTFLTFPYLHPPLLHFPFSYLLPASASAEWLAGLVPGSLRLSTWSQNGASKQCV